MDSYSKLYLFLPASTWLIGQNSRPGKPTFMLTTTWGISPRPNRRSRGALTRPRSPHSTAKPRSGAIDALMDGGARQIFSDQVVHDEDSNRQCPTRVKTNTHCTTTDHHNHHHRHRHLHLLQAGEGGLPRRWRVLCRLGAQQTAREQTLAGSVRCDW